MKIHSLWPSKRRTTSLRHNDTWLKSVKKLWHFMQKRQYVVTEQFIIVTNAYKHNLTRYMLCLRQFIVVINFTETSHKVVRFEDFEPSTKPNQGDLSKVNESIPKASQVKITPEDNTKYTFTGTCVGRFPRLSYCVIFLSTVVYTLFNRYISHF